MVVVVVVVVIVTAAAAAAAVVVVVTIMIKKKNNNNNVNNIKYQNDLSLPSRRERKNLIFIYTPIRLLTPRMKECILFTSRRFPTTDIVYARMLNHLRLIV